MAKRTDETWRENYLRRKDIILATNRAAYARNKHKWNATRKAYYVTNSERIKAKVKTLKREALCFLKYFKEANPCTDCGGYFKACQMDFDHLLDKKYNKMADGSTVAAMKKEMKKCELVCANCHRLRTFHDKENYGFKRRAAP